MNKNLLIIIWSMLMQLNALAQSKFGIENYNYLDASGESLIVPVIHFDGRKNWHTELRYNYEEEHTVSVFGGRRFKGGKQLHFEITPMGGFSMGKFSGISYAFNMDLNWHSIYMSTQTQYSIALKNNLDNFIFSWSEVGINIGSSFFGGVAWQLTVQTGYNKFEKGFTAGVGAGRFTFPFYVFSPFAKNRNFIIGINYEYTRKAEK